MGKQELSFSLGPPRALTVPRVLLGAEYMRQAAQRAWPELLQCEVRIAVDHGNGCPVFIYCVDDLGLLGLPPLVRYTLTLRCQLYPDDSWDNITKNLAGSPLSAVVDARAGTYTKGTRIQVSGSEAVPVQRLGFLLCRFYQCESGAHPPAR